MRSVLIIFFGLLELMSRFIVVTLEVLALIFVLRSAVVQFWLTDMQTIASSWMLDLSMVLENRQLAEFRYEITQNAQNLNYYQEEYIQTITSTKVSLNNFNLLYCINGDKNPYIYGANLRYTCDEIHRENLLTNSD